MKQKVQQAWHLVLWAKARGDFVLAARYAEASNDYRSAAGQAMAGLASRAKRIPQKAD